MQFANVSGTQMDVQWTNGDGAGRLVICRQGSAPSAGPIDGIAYAADADFGGAGSALGGGKVVFAGAGSSFTLTGLALSTTYYLQVYEYNGTGGTLNYLTAGGVNNPNSQATTAAADGAGTAVLSSLTPGPLSGSALFQRAQAGQTVAITVTGPAAGSLASVSVAVPAAWAGLLAGNVTLAGAGFGGASAGVAGNTVTVTGAAVTDANPGEIRLAGLTARDVTLAADGGTDTWTVQSQAVGGTALVALAAGSPVSRVTVPLSLLRAVDGSGVPVRNGETVAVEGVVSAVNGAFSLAYTSAFIQDGAAGVNIYNAAVWDVLRTAGQRAVVLGAVSVYRGLTELVPASAGHIYDLGADAAVAATPRTLAALLAGAELYESTLVRVANLRIVSGTWPATAGSDADLTVSDDLGVTTIVLHIDADTDIDGNAAPPEPFALTGLVSQYAGFAAPYSGGYQLIPRGFGDVGEVTQGTVFSFR